MALQGVGELSPGECLDLDLWEHIFDEHVALKQSPLRALALDMRAQLEVRKTLGKGTPRSFFFLAFFFSSRYS